MNIEKLKIGNELLKEIDAKKNDIKIWEQTEYFGNVDFFNKEGNKVRSSQRIWLRREFLPIKEIHLGKLKKELQELEHKFKIL